MPTWAATRRLRLLTHRPGGATTRRTALPLRPRAGSCCGRAACALRAPRGGGSRGPGEPRAIRVEAADRGVLLADFLNELVFLQESEEVGVARIHVHLEDGGLVAEAKVGPLARPPAGATGRG